MTENQTPGQAPRNGGPERDPWEQQHSGRPEDHTAWPQQSGGAGAGEPGPRENPT